MILRGQFLVLVMACVFVGLTEAQSTSFSRFEVGIEGGPNVTVMYGNKELKSHLEPGFAFTCGASLQVNFTKFFALRTNISFDRRVQCYRGDILIADDLGNTIGYGATHVNFDNIVMPLLVRFTIGERIHYFINLGPYIGMRLQTKLVVKEDDGDVKTHMVEENPFDLGMTAGVGLAIPINDRFTASCEVRNNIAFLPTLKDGELKTNATDLLFGVSYNFPLHY